MRAAPLLLVPLAAGLLGAAAPEASRFGLDYAFPWEARYRAPEMARLHAEAGLQWVDFAGIAWSAVEPRAPSHGRHTYQWKVLDEAVQVWQEAGFHLVFSVKLGNGWFSGEPAHRPEVLSPLVFLAADRLPQTRYRDDWRSFLQALVERYDHDGVDDAKGLRSPVLHVQIGNEYANPFFWVGSAADYRVLLADAAQAIHAAHPEARVISNGIRWNDLFHGDPTGASFEATFASFLQGQEPGWRDEWVRAREVTEATVAAADLYDVLDAGGNGPYPTSSAGYMAWVRSTLARFAPGRSPTIWDMEARCEPYLAWEPNTRFHPDLLAVPDAKSWFQALDRESDPRHREAVRWYRAEQARLAVKVFVTRFSAGFERVFLGMPDDWDDKLLARLATANPYLGLADTDGVPWPAWHATRLAVEKLDGFATAERIPAPPDPAAPGDAATVEIHRFTFADGRAPVWVAWVDPVAPAGPERPEVRRTIRLDAWTGPLTATPTPTGIQDRKDRTRAWEVLTLPDGAVEVGETPVFVQAR